MIMILGSRKHMPKEKKQLDLTNENIHPIKVIALLAWPLFLEQILATLVSFADTAMVGALGVSATASVSISNPVVFLINGAVISMGVGITAYVARSVGAKNYDAAKAYIRHALLLLLCVGAPTSAAMMLLHRQIPAWMGAEDAIMDTAARYMLITSAFRVFAIATMLLGSVFRGIGDTKTPLRINTCVNLLNVIGNYLLINPSHTIVLGPLEIPMIGAGMGVIGAALSTGFSWFVGGTIMVVKLFTTKGPTQISIRDSFRPDLPLIRRVVTLSIPAMLERLCMSGAGIVVTKAIASLGTTVIAANTVASTAESMSYMPAMAFATAATTLVGQSLGAKKPQLAERYAWYNVAMGAVILGLAGVGLYVFAEPLCRLFTPDPEALAIASESLRIVSFVQPIQSMAWIFAGALRGAGDTRWPFYITAICNWTIRTAGSCLCVYALGLGLPATIVCMCLDNTVRCIWLWIRFRNGKWKNVIKDSPASV